MAGQKITLENVLAKLDKMETEIQKRKKNEIQLMRKNDELESEILKYLDDLLALKRFQVDVERELKESKTAKSEVDDLKSALNTQPAAEDLTRKETMRIFKKMKEYGYAINTLTERFNTGMEKLDLLEDRVEKLHCVYNRGLVSSQATKDLGKEVSELKTEISILTPTLKQQQHQNEQLQLQQQLLQQSLQQQHKQPQQQSVFSLPSSPAPETAPPPLPPRRYLKHVWTTPQLNNNENFQEDEGIWICHQHPDGAGSATLVPVPQKRTLVPTPSTVPPTLSHKPSIRSTQKELKKIQDRSHFDVFGPSSLGSLQTGQEIVAKEYCIIITDSLDMNRETSVYETPIKGKYRFGGVTAQHGNGKIRLFICEDDEGKRELLGTTDGDGIRRDLDVTWECKEGVGVWLEIERIEGEAGLLDCRFHGRLLLN